MMFFRSPQGKTFLATIDMVAPISSIPRYSRPPSQISTQNTRSVRPPERPCHNSAGQVTSNPFFWSLRTMRIKRERLRALDWSPSLLARLVPCCCWPCVSERVVLPGLGCPQEGSGFFPGVRFGSPPDRSAFLSHTQRGTRGGGKGKRERHNTRYKPEPPELAASAAHTRTGHCTRQGSSGAQRHAPIPRLGSLRASPRWSHWRQASSTGPAAPAPRATTH